jgi:hypothetical protein
MMRVAAAFGLIAVATVILIALRTDGASAIVFSFVGFPALAVALTLYGVARWRAGAFSFKRSP